MCENEKDYVLDLVLAFYVGEPCRICGNPMTPQDAKTRNGVFAGYSVGNASRSAHLVCWNKNLPQEQWAYPDSSKEN